LEQQQRISGDLKIALSWWQHVSSFVLPRQQETLQLPPSDHHLPPLLAYSHSLSECHLLKVSVLAISIEERSQSYWGL
jgi:hypothetical protein